jgi:hypothetical protein
MPVVRNFLQSVRLRGCQNASGRAPHYGGAENAEFAEVEFHVPDLCVLCVSALRQ